MVAEIVSVKQRDNSSKEETTALGEACSSLKGLPCHCPLCV